MTFNPYSQQDNSALRERCNQIRDMIYRRAVLAYYVAVGSKTVPPQNATLDMCVIHNSLVAFDCGRPWLEIDYSAMRRAKWLTDRMDEPGKIADKLWRRRTAEMRAAA